MDALVSRAFGDVTFEEVGSFSGHSMLGVNPSYPTSDGSQGLPLADDF